jgi:hypothetical protein
MDKIVRSVTYVNAVPSPKQKKRFLLETGAKEFPGWAIPTRQGASLAIRQLLNARMAGRNIAKLLLSEETFAEKWVDDKTVEVPTKVPQLKGGIQVMALLSGQNINWDKKIPVAVEEETRAQKLARAAVTIEEPVPQEDPFAKIIAVPRRKVQQ